MASAAMIPMITGIMFPLGPAGGVIIVVFVLVVEVTIVDVDMTEPVRKVVDEVTVETIVVVEVPVKTNGADRRIVESASVPPNDWAKADGNSGSDPTIQPESGSVR
jgi:hypothetical protein